VGKKRYANCSLCGSEAKIVTRGELNDEYVTCSKKKCAWQNIPPMTHHNWDQMQNRIAQLVNEGKRMNLGLNKEEE